VRRISGVQVCFAGLTNGEKRMSRNVPAEELDMIERVISEYPEGIGISALERALAPNLLRINRRTLQRRLKRLVEDRKIISEGESIALVYKHSPSSVGSSRSTVHVAHSPGIEMESYVPVPHKEASSVISSGNR
jgi:hypothetical protein